MEPIGWQIVSRLADGRIIAPTLPERRRLARVVLELGKSRGLLVFSGSDNHLHLATAASRMVAGELARAAEVSLRKNLALPVPFERARITPIHDQRHLRNAVHYLFGNAPRHGNFTDPHCEGTNLPDVLGLRLIGRYTGYRLRELLPRLALEELLQHLRVDGLHPGGTPRFIPEAAAAALALPDLSAHDNQTRQARIAAVRVAVELGLQTIQIADLLHTASRTIRRYRTLLAPPLLVRAIQLQLGLMEDTARLVTGASQFS
jgi:hypothetical protein